VRINWQRIPATMLPFADAATPELPLPRLLRLSLFQVTVGMAAALLIGTLNRVMIVELKMSASLVAAILALPLIFAPARALIGFRSDTHRSHLGWRRVPYLWLGTLAQFGGLAILPFALLVMTGGGTGPAWIGQAGAALALLMIGAGLHTTQTAGLALATDLVPEEARARVVALLYTMLLIGTLVSAVVIGALLKHFTPLHLIQVVQGAGALTMILNLIALWKQEARNPAATARRRSQPSFAESWRTFIQQGRAPRLLVTVGLGAAAFSMEDVLVEPYGGQVLGLSVGATTWLTAVWAAGTLAGFALAAIWLKRGWDSHRLAGLGIVVGLAAFACVILAAPMASAFVLSVGVVTVGVGGGLFSVGTLTAAMTLVKNGGSGMALGAWGAVEASATGVAILGGGVLRDAIARTAERGLFGPGLAGPTTGYVTVYCLEILLLFATLVALGPLVRRAGTDHYASTGLIPADAAAL